MDMPACFCAHLQIHIFNDTVVRRHKDFNERSIHRSQTPVVIQTGDPARAHTHTRNTHGRGNRQRGRHTRNTAQTQAHRPTPAAQHEFFYRIHRPALLRCPAACMYECMHVCTHAGMCACMRACMQARIPQSKRSTYFITVLEPVLSACRVGKARRLVQEPRSPPLFFEGNDFPVTHGLGPPPRVTAASAGT